jgi:nanoRNase/pAp phosphatase (c-di-AMP/oligoRNAs hydrolase)
VGWFQNAEGKYVYSLRSRHGFDVSELAKKFGGGGHAGAAGFTVSKMVHE